MQSVLWGSHHRVRDPGLWKELVEKEVLNFVSS